MGSGGVETHTYSRLFMQPGATPSGSSFSLALTRPEREEERKGEEQGRRRSRGAPELREREVHSALRLARRSHDSALLYLSHHIEIYFSLSHFLRKDSRLP